ncbi:hypothetical protein [Thalassoporum mexicanum]|uniref:hypothetical protein n=1 Tax=Thalassoporum mexicanum TaxID=3457544 RepID=UPI0030DB06CB
MGQSASNSLVMGLGSKLRSLSITIALALIMYVTIGLTPAASAIAAPITFTPPMPIAVISTTKVTLHDNPTVPGEVKDRFSKIVNTMQKMRFCNRESCFYRGLESNIQATQSEQEPYAATIHAEIDRPASFFDYADYHFAYVGDRWRLMGAEEYTDVADYVFKGDKYEIFSVHASRILRGNIEDALNRTSSLKSGYVPLYYSVLRYGVERD